DRIAGLLDDEDSYVRTTAVQALLSGYDSSDFTSTKKSEPPSSIVRGVMKAVESHPDLLGPAIRAYIQADQVLPGDLMDQLESAPRDVKLNAIQSMRPNNGRTLDFVESAAESGDDDLATVALRILAQSPDDSDRTRSILISVLGGDSPEKRSVVLDHLNWHGPKTTSRSLWTAAVESLQGGVGAADSAGERSPGPATKQDDVLSSFGIGGTPSTAGPGQPSADTPPSPQNAALDAFGLGGTSPTAPIKDPTTAEPATATSADVMDAFGLAPASGSAPTRANAPSSPAETLEIALYRLADVPDLSADTPEAATARAAARLLIRGGSSLPVERLASHLSQMDVQDRADLAADLGKQPHPGFLPIWKRLLHDPSTEVRQRALRSALDDDYPVLVGYVLGEAFSPASPTEIPELYSRYLEYLCENRDTKRTMADIGRQLLDGDSDTPRQVLGLIILRNAQSSSDRPLIESKLESPDYWVRRAAVISLGKASLQSLT
ncbi:MAG: hypothetical protein KDM63_20110, partial [Verrucomicrobiae bacterium]|nr:hypothetical protein [Verrucomicrobiae bacterium]